MAATATTAALICIAAGARTLALAGASFVLSWTHSVEKTTWTEWWTLTDAGFAIERASVEGSGAGMDPPEGAVLRDGAWVYRPKLPPQERLVLASSGATVGGWRICAQGTCSVVGDSEGQPIVIARCDDAATPD